MKAEKKKISTRQLVLLFIISTFSPAIRLFPHITAKIAKQAGWLSPIAAGLIFIILVLIIQAFFKKGNDINLSDVYFKILGNVLGRIVVGLYFIWVLILLALYVRYYAERILSSILPSTSMHFLIIAILGLVFYTVRGGIVSLARYNELLFIIFIIIFSSTNLIHITNINLNNLLPISYKDIVPITYASYGMLSIWGYFLFVFFFADKVNDKEHIKKLGIKTSIFITATAIAIIATAVGMFGYSLTIRVSLPYFDMVKIISISRALERLESVALSIWIIADYILIATFMYIAVSIAKSLFSLTGTKRFVSPLVLLTYSFSLVLVKNRFELETFSTSIALPVNLVFQFVIPLFIFTVGKLRKVI